MTAKPEYYEKRIKSRTEDLVRINERLASANEWLNDCLDHDESNLKSAKAGVKRWTDCKKKAEADIKKFNEKLNEAMENEDNATIKIPALIEYLDNWKNTIINLMKEHIDDYLSAMDEITKNNPSYKDFVKARNYLLNTNSVYNLLHQYQNGLLIEMDKAERDFEKEKMNKYISIVRRTMKIVGEITDAKHLSIGNSGEINGVIIGTEGKAHVETIGAGGYNVQIFHFRTLVKPIKSK